METHLGIFVRVVAFLRFALFGLLLFLFLLFVLLLLLFFGLLFLSLFFFFRVDRFLKSTRQIKSKIIASISHSWFTSEDSDDECCFLFFSFFLRFFFSGVESTLDDSSDSDSSTSDSSDPDVDDLLFFCNWHNWQSTQ